MVALHGLGGVEREFMRFLPPCTLVALVVISGCSSSSSSGVMPFVPGFDASFVASGDGAVTHTDGGGVVSPDGGIVGSPDTGVLGHDGGGTPPGTDASVVVIPSSGIVITVIPDGTGDAAGLLTAMKNATTAVHMEMYLLTNQTYINELITLHDAGKDVKVVLNQTFPTGTSASDTNASTYSTLQARGSTPSGRRRRPGSRTTRTRRR